MSAAFRLNQVSMVLLGVQSVERSLEFYRDKLGLEVATAFPGFAFLAAGGIQLVLSEGLGKQYGQRSAAAEIVFPVQDVAAAHRELSDRGVTFTQPPRQVTPTDWAANFDDLDGHHFSIFGPERAA